MKRPRGLSLIERALIARDWHASAVEAQIHALIGEDSNAVVNAAGRLLFVVLGAAMADGVSPDHEELGAVRGGVNAVHDQAGVPDIPDARRVEIVNGLHAATRLLPELTQRSVVASAIDLELKLRRGDIRLSDFEALIASAKATGHSPRPGLTAALT